MARRLPEPPLNQFQFGSRPSSLIPTDVWLQVQCESPEHNAYTRAVCEERQTDLAMEEKETEVRRFRCLVEERVRERERVRREEERAARRRQRKKSSRPSSGKARTVRTALPKNWTPHQEKKVRSWLKMRKVGDVDNDDDSDDLRTVSSINSLTSGSSIQLFKPVQQKPLNLKQHNFPPAKQRRQIRMRSFRPLEAATSIHTNTLPGKPRDSEFAMTNYHISPQHSIISSSSEEEEKTLTRTCQHLQALRMGARSSMAAKINKNKQH